MAATITAVTITPQTVEASGNILIQVSATFTSLTMAEMNNMTFGHIDTHTMGELDTIST